MPEEKEADLEGWGYSQEGRMVEGAGLCAAYGYPTGIHGASLLHHRHPQRPDSHADSVGNWTEVEKKTDRLPTHAAFVAVEGRGQKQNGS